MCHAQHARRVHAAVRAVIITGIVDKWKASKKWNRDYLVRLCGDRRLFTCGAVKMSMAHYFRWVRVDVD